MPCDFLSQKGQWWTQIGVFGAEWGLSGVKWYWIHVCFFVGKWLLNVSTPRISGETFANVGVFQKVIFWCLFWANYQNFGWWPWAIWSRFGACLFKWTWTNATTCSDQWDREWLCLHHLSLSIWFNENVSLPYFFWSYSRISLLTSVVILFINDCFLFP